MKKKAPIPKIDLSKYTDSNNLPISIEKIIVEGLIAYKCDTDKVEEHFSLNPDIVNSVYIKYYSELSNIYQKSLSTKNIDESLNDSCTIFNKHIKEIKKYQNLSKTKILKSSELTNLCKMVDRITSVRDQATKSYDTMINKLANNITNLKLSEARINGPIEDNSDYLENQNSVFDMLNEFRESPNNKKPVLLIEKDTNEIIEFDSLAKCAEFLDTKANYIRKKIDSKTPYKEKYYIKFKEE